MKKLCAGILCVMLLGLCACVRQAAPEETTQVTKPEETSIGYFDMVWGWKCPEGEYSQYIDRIYHTECGTAGSASKSAISGVAVLDFSKAFAGDDAHALVSTFDAMNDSQARFFASQWIRLNVLAKEALRDPVWFRETFGWAGLEEFDAALYSIQEVNVLNDVIASLLCRPEMNGG